MRKMRSKGSSSRVHSGGVVVAVVVCVVVGVEQGATPAVASNWTSRSVSGGTNIASEASGVTLQSM